MFDDLRTRARESDQPLDAIVRLHVLESVVRRVPFDAPVVLRGSLLTRHVVAPFPRTVGDVDYVGTGSDAVDDVKSVFCEALPRDLSDGVRFEPSRIRAKGIWRDTAFPGVRLAVVAEAFGRRHSITIDVAFGDPLIPAAGPLAYAPLVGETFRVHAADPTTMLAWKLHGLAEWGAVRWRPKDLLDLWLLARRETRPEQEVRAAIVAAFESRGFDATSARATLESAHWDTASAEARWTQFVDDTPEYRTLERNPARLRDSVLDVLRPALP